MGETAVKWPLLRFRYDAWPAVRRGLGSLLAYEIIFKIASFFLLGPLTVALLNVLIGRTGEPSVANTQMVSFLLSPLGIATLILFATLTLTIFFMEDAGLCLILLHQFRQRNITLLQAVRLTLWDTPALLGIAFWHVVLGLACALPFAGLAALTYWLFLSGADINYYLAERPPQFFVAVGIGLVLALGGAAVFAFLFVRWAFAVPICLFEGKREIAALRASAALVKGSGWRIFASVLAWQLGKLLVFQIAAFVLIRLNEGILYFVSGDSRWVLWDVAALVALDIVLFVGLSIADMVGFSLLVTYLYENLHRARGGPLPDRLVHGEAQTRGNKRLPLPGRVVFVGVMVCALVVTAWQAKVIIDQFLVPREVYATAHRAGAAERAPENSVSALRLAMEEGADYAEIDVQETADGVVVVLHDKDLRRLAGVATRNIWEMKLAEARSFDLGKRFGPKYRGERLATLEEFIEAARPGTIKLNIELKYYGQKPTLAWKVVRMLQQKGFLDRVVISSLNAQALAEVRRLEPRLKTGYIVAASLGDLTRLKLNFLSLEMKKVTPLLLSLARRHHLEVHAWTVNRREDMVKMLNLGVDNLITDEPELALEVIDWYQNLSDPERLLLRFRHWLRS
jgi:glycerophosphoryl diester phosphodiesterase